MNRRMDVRCPTQNAFQRFMLSACFVAAAFISTSAQSLPQALPQVHLEAAGLAPRPIEELTGTAVVHNYASAWHDLSDALESGRSDRLGDQFTGFAKDRFAKRIQEQNQTGVQVRIIDHGHQLKAVFYSSDGSAMQLFDRAQLEIQTFDGQKLIATENTPREYVVLMTPGADRWYVRDLREVPSASTASIR